MSIALDTNRRIGPSTVFPQAGLPSYCSILNANGIVPVARRDDAIGDALAPVEELDRCSSSSSSSIGRNSDLSVRSSEDDDGEDNEAESSFEGPLKMESLEEVLPIRRGISNFYRGKSKSFTALADASSATTIKDIAKPENAYSRKRRNLLASSLIWDKNRTGLLKGNAGGISKRPISSSRSLLAMAVAISNSDSYTSGDSNSKLPPLRPPYNGRASRSNLASAVSPVCKYSAWRSYSAADLQ